MSARQGLALLYGLCDEWTARRQLLGALGGDPDHLDQALTPSTSTGSDPEARDVRQAEIAAFIGAVK